MMAPPEPTHYWENQEGKPPAKPPCGKCDMWRYLQVMKDEKWQGSCYCGFPTTGEWWPWL